jgi:tRNA G18 (ribose-2'-O)-methylase SpoU
LSHVYLGGITPTPAHPDLAKTALGAERSVPWTHEADAVVLAGRLRESGVRLVALEGGAGDEFFATLPWAAGRYCLVVGHEVSGIDPRLQALCERTVYLPMAGVKGSLNVSVALGIAAYCVRHGVTAPP